MIRFILFLIKKFDKVVYVHGKATARCPNTFICDKGKNKYLVVAGKSNIQKFYIRRSIKMQKKFADDLSEYFYFNFPIDTSEKYGVLYVIYNYFSDILDCKTDEPIRFLTEAYEKYASTVIVSDDSIRKTINKFFEAWPPEYHSRIIKLETFQTYIRLLRKQEKLIMYFEHGDFTSNNIVHRGSKIYLLDFEFSNEFQPIGLDEYDFYMSINKELCQEEIGKAKHILCDNINQIMDWNCHYKRIRMVEMILYSCVIKAMIIWKTFSLR